MEGPEKQISQPGWSAAAEIGSLIQAKVIQLQRGEKNSQAWPEVAKAVTLRGQDLCMPIPPDLELVMLTLLCQVMHTLITKSGHLLIGRHLPLWTYL